jgi:hypothetical protein
MRNHEPAPREGELVLYDAACRAMAEAEPVDELLQIRDRARFLAACAIAAAAKALLAVCKSNLALKIPLCQTFKNHTAEAIDRAIPIGGKLNGLIKALNSRSAPRSESRARRREGAR